MQTNQRSCPVCRGEIFPQKVFKVSAFEPSEEDLSVLKDSTNIDNPDPKGKGKAKAEPEDEEIDEILKELDLGDNIEPSAKMIKMMEYIKECMFLSRFQPSGEWILMIDFRASEES